MVSPLSLESARPHYNRYALGHYAKGLQAIRDHLAAGQSLRFAILCEFNGRLADKLLRAAEKHEAAGAGPDPIDMAYEDQCARQCGL